MLFVFLLSITLVLIFSAIYYGIGPNLTPKRALRLIVESFPKDVKVIYDLGSGFGVASFYFARKRPEATVIGVEASLIPYLFSKIFCLFQKNLKIICKNFYTVSLEEADVVYCYLYRGAMKKLEDKFNNELKDSAIVISYTFSLHKSHGNVYDLGGFYQNKLYCYQYKKESL